MGRNVDMKVNKVNVGFFEEIATSLKNNMRKQ
jgi:hypothetical protein